jgi:hypothetical protein
VEDYGNKYNGEPVEIALSGGDNQEGTLTLCSAIDDVHVELNGHILVPFRNIASIRCTTRRDAPASDWPPRGLGDASPEDEP